jgi:hypothetical protein
MSMVARKKMGPAAALIGLGAGLLAQNATAGEHPVYRAPAPAEFRVDVQAFRSDIDSYIRSTNEQLRTTLGQELRRELAPKLELASNELRARG